MSLRDIKEIPGLLNVTRSSNYGSQNLKKTFNKALNDFLDSRIDEGKKIKNSLKDKINKINIKQKQISNLLKKDLEKKIKRYKVRVNELTKNYDDYYPEQHRSEINSLNDLIYETVNNGVYKSGFAKTQEAYEEAVAKLFETLNKLEDRLSSSKYLIGENVTEADFRLIPTLLRFDAVYVTHFKCNLRRIIDYKNLSRYVQDMLLIPAVKDLSLIHI